MRKIRKAIPEFQISIDTIDELYPDASGATRNRQVITPAQAIINHCAERDLCAPVRIKRFKFVEKVKKPVTLEWLNTFCDHARPVIKALVLDMFATACRFNEVAPPRVEGF